MKFQSKFAAVAAAAFLTVGGLAYGDANNIPSQGNNVDGTGTAGAAHGQPNTGDTGGAMTPDNVNGANATGANMRHMNMNGDSLASQIRSFGQDPSTAGDKMFALDAGCGNMWEVQFAKLEQEKGSDQQVKQIASTIEKDHSQAEQKLEPIASKLGVNIPQSLPADKQAKLDVISKLPADQIDKAYLSDMKADHLKDVNMYADHEKMVQNADLRQYITETMPKLREHTAMVLKQNQTMGMPAETNFQTNGSMNQ